MDGQTEAGEDQYQSALLSNLAAVRAVTGAIEGTLGPRGLDCMLLGAEGDVILTNDGVTILQHLDAPHPAARLLIEAAKAQQRAVGDGTTTATILAGALIGEGANQVLRGVPVIRVIDGIRAGVAAAISALDEMRRPVHGVEDPLLPAVARIAGRGDASLAETVLAAVRMLGADRLQTPGFEMAAAVLGLEGAADEALPGIVIEREPVAAEMPMHLAEAPVMLFEGGLEPESTPPEALASRAGVSWAEAKRAAFQASLRAMAEAGVRLVLTGRGMADEAAQFLSDQGILGLRRVAEADLRRVAAMTGARLLRRLPSGPGEAASALGRTAQADVDQSRRSLRLQGGGGLPEVTVIIGGSTAEIAAERVRIARDAAAAVVQALRGGVVPGGGAAELALARTLAGKSIPGADAYGWTCVCEALKRPLAQLASNAGFAPLEKVEAVTAAQEGEDSASLGLKVDDGTVIDLAMAGIWDPYPVKAHALRTAGEIATAVLRINNILKMRAGACAEETWHDPA